MKPEGIKSLRSKEQGAGISKRMHPRSEERRASESAKNVKLCQLRAVVDKCNHLHAFTQ